MAEITSLLRDDTDIGYGLILAGKNKQLSFEIQRASANKDIGQGREQHDEEKDVEPDSFFGSIKLCFGCG